MSRKVKSRARRLVWLVVLLVGVVAVSSLTAGAVYANKNGTVNTVFFGNLEDKGDGCGVFTVLDFIIQILTFGVGVAAMIGIMISGITMLTAKGNVEQFAKGKRRIAEIVIGLAVYAVLWAILMFLLPGGEFNKSACSQSSNVNNSWWTEPDVEEKKTGNSGRSGGRTSSGGSSGGGSSSGGSSSSAAEAIKEQDDVNYVVILSGKAKANVKGKGLLVLEPDEYTKAQIKAFKNKGWTVLGYLSVGSYEGERVGQKNAEGKTYYKTNSGGKLKDYAANKMDDWPEHYAYVEKSGWQGYLNTRAKWIKSMGYDGIWADNLDVYEYRKSDKVYDACKKILKNLKNYGYVMVNGGKMFFEKVMNSSTKLTTIVDGVTQEEVFSKVKKYSGTGTFGKQSSGDSSDYKKYLQKVKNAGAQTFLLEYTKDASLKKKIDAYCNSNKVTGCYVSKDVDLHPQGSWK